MAPTPNIGAHTYMPVRNSWRTVGDVHKSKCVFSTLGDVAIPNREETQMRKEIEALVFSCLVVAVVAFGKFVWKHLHEKLKRVRFD